MTQLGLGTEPLRSFGFLSVAVSSSQLSRPRFVPRRGLHPTGNVLTRHLLILS